MKKRVYLIAMLSIFAVQESGWAEDKQTVQASPVTMEEVVVSATKTEEMRKDVVNSIILKDATDIDESSAESLGELLANEPGVDWRTRGGYGGASEEIRIRGMESNATQVLVNGISVNSPSLGRADVSKIPLNNIERIEVVKGAGSLLYGSGAMGGTVNIMTKRPERDETAARVRAGYGSQGSYRISVEQGMFAFGDFGYYLTAGRSETDGFRDNSDLTHNDVSLNLVFDKGDGLNISLYGEYVDREFGLPGVKPLDGTKDYFINNQKFYNDDVADLLNHGSDKDGRLVFRVRSRPVDWLAFHFTTHYVDMENYYYGRYRFNGTGDKTWVNNRVSGVEANIDITPFQGASLLLGSEYKDYDWERDNISLDNGGIEINGSKTGAESGLHTTGAFAEASYRPCNFFKALAGIRHEDHSTFGSELLPLYGLIINPLKNTVLKLSHGKHFMAPTLNDLFWPEDPYTKGNPDLKPETGHHTDVTFEQTLFDDKLFVTLSYFCWNVDDKILWDLDANWLYTPQNLNSYKADGMEAGVKIALLQNFSFAVNYTYTDAKEENEFVTRRATYTPAHQLKGDLTFWSDFGFSGMATVRYVGER
ncbi:MAG: TonB-dependent receptor, partial [Desulfobulbaceae bacterium]|nr:TonB-dependent receptor [Desulfobulbaceae bacterium]